MSPPGNNDPLDALLRKENPSVADDGFARRVISALPRRRSHLRLRQLFLVGVTLVGWVLAALWLPWGTLPPLDLSALLSLNPQILWPWVAVLTVTGSLIWAVIAAVQWED